MTVKMLPAYAPDRSSRFSHRCLFFVAALSLTLFSYRFVETSAAQETARKVVSRTAPAYPELAKRMHLTGKVKLDVLVAANGSVKSASLVGGNPVFERNAIDAVKQWKFESAATETKISVILEFADQ